jgi:hypothetical protein
MDRRCHQRHIYYNHIYEKKTRTTNYDQLGLHKYLGICSYFFGVIVNMKQIRWICIEIKHFQQNVS